MAGAGQAPVIPEWAFFDCAGCGLCCRRGWHIGCTAPECERITSAAWDNAPVTECFVGDGDRKRLTLAPDGACVFLDPDNRCRIHARLGEAAKPATCRTYPMQIISVAGQTRVGLHFSCPAVIDGTGRPLAARRASFLELCSCTAKPGADSAESVRFFGKQRLQTDALAVFDRSAEAIWTAPLSSLRKALAMSDWIELAARYYTDDMDPALWADCARGYLDKALAGARDGGVTPPQTGVLDRWMFRLATGAASEMAVPELLSPVLFRRLGARGRRLTRAARFLVHRGAFRISGVSGRFADIRHAPAFPLPEQADAMLSRWMRMRFWSRGFFGRPCFGLDMVHGARFLLGLYGVALYLARALATAADRAVTAEDVRAAILHVEYTYGHMDGAGISGLRLGLAAITRAGWGRTAILHGALSAGA